MPQEPISVYIVGPDDSLSFEAILAAAQAAEGMRYLFVAWPTREGISMTREARACIYDMAAPDFSGEFASDCGLYGRPQQVVACNLVELGAK